MAAIISNRRKFARALTLTELMTVFCITLIIVMMISVMLVAGQRQWAHTYYNANTGIQFEALQTMVTFGSIGRESNKSDYVVYKLVGGYLVKAQPPTGSPVSVVTGDAVEFRHWDTDFNAGMMDSTITGNTYALFYREGQNLKVDEGPYDSATHIGGVSGGIRLHGTGVVTRVLSSRVTSLVFSHTTKNAAGDGDGSVRINAVLTDPCDNSTIAIKAATLMRNVWP